MIISYLPTDTISIDQVNLKFGDNRELVRKQLAGIYKEDNQIISVGNSEIEPIFQRRDIYQNINSTENFFFLGYDKNDLLNEIEVHHCNKIKVFEVLFNFSDELDFIASRLSRYTSIEKHGEGEYFFIDLKIVIMDKKQMGGDGNTLGYFYCASDVSHIENNNTQN